MNCHGVVFGVLLFLSMVSANAVEDEQAGRIAQGTETAAELSARYAATPSRCDDGSPAYRCSGVIVRGTRQSMPAGQHAWEPYPRGRVMDTSFTFLRADLSISRLAWAYTNGFIIAPPDALSVNCYFPVDGVSDNRLDKGCGPDKTQVQPYALCQALLADRLVEDRDSEEYQWALEKLAGLWLAWDKKNNADVRRRCSYDLTGPLAAQRFELALAVSAKALKQTEVPNDLKIQTWEPGHDPRLPIKAFFYINDKGKAFAERDRDQFEEMTQIHLPVLKLSFRGGPDGKTAFEFLEQ